MAENHVQKGSCYDATYPLTSPVTTEEGVSYRVAIIADADRDSKLEDYVWASYMKTGTFFISHDKKTVTVTWDDDVITITSKFSYGGRGMELSELTTFNGRLYSVCDRTGILYHITPDFQAQPWVLLNDGDGNTTKGFKGEWLTVKDGILYAGCLGKEWTSRTGEIENCNQQWVKTVGQCGDVLHHDWRDKYNVLRSKGGFEFPGYLIHESCVWSDVHKKWFFLPRRASKEAYDGEADEKRGTNLLFTATEDFSEVEQQEMGPLNPARGFSAFKFVPGTDDSIIVALKSVEVDDETSTYLTVLTLAGEVIMEETQLADVKYEGFEFI